MRISACLIAKNERDNVRPCLESFWDHVDECVFCDTGSRDGTVAETRAFAQERGELGKLIVGHFRWRDDFAAARNQAASLATGEIHMWVDLDDRVVGAENLREVVDVFEDRPELDRIWAKYVYERGPDLAPTYFEEGRARLFRAPVSWINPTWEEVAGDGDSGWTNRMWWWHRKTRARGTRDLEIARAWAQRDPQSITAAQAIVGEAFPLGKLDEAIAAADRALGLPALASRQRGWLLGKLAELKFAFDDYDASKRYAREALRVCPDERAAARVLIKCLFLNDDWNGVLAATLGRVHPGNGIAFKQDQLLASVLQAYAAAELGRWETACEAAETALSLFPGDDPDGGVLLGHLERWRRRRR